MKRNIEIINITPRGFCNGVVKAIIMINNVLKENKYKKPLYIYGELVHNTHITNAFKDEGIITIKDYSTIKEGTIIVTAHGLSEHEKQTIISQGVDIIDTTCKEVLKIQTLVKEKINDGYTVIYYGKLNHPECKAVLNDNDNIILVTNINDVKNININSDKLFFTNQTTMSYFDTLDIINELKKKYSNIDVNIDICTASKQRQVAVYDKCKECDIVLVIGDKKSNNTNKLKEICESLNIKSYLIETIEDLNKVDLYDNIKIGITAGSSTPNKLVNEIIKSLEDDEYISNLSNKDLITF